ncbi:Solute carrier family 17 member 5 [Balamuthia mandrillaris]
MFTSGARTNVPMGAKDASSVGWYIPRRLILAGLLFTVSVIAYADRINITVAAVLMKNELGWTEGQKGLIMSGFFYGYLLSNIFGGWFASKHGGKRALTWGCLGWSLATLLFPLFTSRFFFMFLARFFTGLLQGVLFPATYTLLSTWIPPLERSRILALCNSGCIIGIAISSFFFPRFMTQFHWSTVFYWCGAAGFFWVAVWEHFVTDSPSSHPSIEAAEANYIERSLDKQGLPGAKSNADISIMKRVPWRSIIKTKAFLCIVVCHFSRNWIVYVMMSWLPTFFTGALHVDFKDLGAYATLPWLVMSACTNMFGWLADQMAAGRSFSLFSTSGRNEAASAATEDRYDRLLRVRKRMQIIGTFGPALFMLLMASRSTAWGAMLCLSVALGLAGATTSGYEASLADIAPSYAGILYGLSNGVAALPGVIGVSLTGWLVSHSTYPWLLAVSIPVCLNFVGGVLFSLWATARPLF